MYFKQYHEQKIGKTKSHLLFNTSTGCSSILHVEINDDIIHSLTHIQASWNHSHFDLYRSSYL